MIRKIFSIIFCLSAIVGSAQTSSLRFDFHTGGFSQSLLSEDIDSITFGHNINSVSNFDYVEEVWNYSQTSGNTTSWMTTGSQGVEDIALANGKLYAVCRGSSATDHTIKIIDAYTGAQCGSLNTSSCTVGVYNLSSVETLDNSIIACNLTIGGNFIIYKWNDDTSEPEMMLNTTAPCNRIGDAMSVSGDMENGRIWFVYESKVYYYTISNGKITSTKPTVIELSDYIGTYSNVTVEDDGSFWVGSIHSYGDKLPAHFTANGVFIEDFPNVLPDKSGTDLKFITYNRRKYGIASSYLNTSADSYADGSVLLVDMCAGMRLSVLPELGLGSSRNTSRRSSICTEVKNDYLYVWLNVPFQGAACYRLSSSDVIEDEAMYENVWTKYGVSSNKINDDDYISFSPKLTNEYGITLGLEVDLGLSVNWSGWDLGATSAMEYGVHFAWGELIPRAENFSNDGYLHYNTSTYGYNFIGEEISGTNYDAARYHLGEGWRMPTKAEADELLQNCTWVYSVVANNIPGYKVIGPNGNSIFLPLNGHMVRDELIANKVHCCYWVGTLESDSEGNYNNNRANVLLYGPEEKKTETVVDNRRWGHCIRPVKSKE